MDKSSYMSGKAIAGSGSGQYSRGQWQNPQATFHSKKIQAPNSQIRDKTTLQKGPWKRHKTDSCVWKSEVESERKEKLYRLQRLKKKMRCFKTIPHNKTLEKIDDIGPRSLENVPKGWESWTNNKKQKHPEPKTWKMEGNQNPSHHILLKIFL